MYQKPTWSSNGATHENRSKNWRILNGVERCSRSMTSSERKIPDIVTQYLTGERFDSGLMLACIVWYTGTIRHNNTFTRRFVFEFLSVILLKIYPEKSLFFIESFSRKIFGLSLAKATLQNILLEIIETNEKWMKMFSCHFCVSLLQWVQSTGHYSVVKLTRTRWLVQTVANLQGQTQCRWCLCTFSIGLDIMVMC